MDWQVCRVAFRLRSPLHVGLGRVGNLQRTRPYITGRALWGALTARITRDAAQGPAADSREYVRIGEQVDRNLAFTYFYPAVRANGGYEFIWPWEDEEKFRRCLLGGYASTALMYPRHVAAEGTLHELEFISPNLLDSGEPVYVVGYVFERDGCTVDWRRACQRLQVGAERAYGWGRVELSEIGDPQGPGAGLFGGQAEFTGGEDRPVVHVPASVGKPARLLAHALAEGLPALGQVEPLVGREWRSDNARAPYVGQHLGFVGVCFVPGSAISAPRDFEVGRLGVWRSV